MTPRQAASGQLQALEKSVPDRPRAKPRSLRGILKQSQFLMNRSRMPRPDLLRPEMEKESNQIHQSPKSSNPCSAKKPNPKQGGTWESAGGRTRRAEVPKRFNW